MTPTTHVKQYFHWLLIITPLVSIPIALSLGADERITEIVFIIAAVLANTILLIRGSRPDRESEQSMLRIFLRDELMPDKSGQPLDFHTDVFVIEDDDNQDETFTKSLEEVFPRTGGTQGLIIRSFTCGASETESERLRTHIDGAHAVLVVRTKGLEEKEWIYRELDTFAYKRSDVPILFTHLGEEDRKSKIPDKFRSIPDDPKSLPWRLIKRANDRGFEWRKAASFNRLLGTNAIILLIASLLLGYYLIDRQRRRELGNLRAIFVEMAQQTKDDYQAVTPDPKNGDFNVSYWIRYKGQIRQLWSTQQKIVPYMSMTDNKVSDVGCAFAYNTATTQWTVRNPNHIDIWDKDGRNIEDPDCKFQDENGEPPRELVCQSFNSTTTPLDPSVTVGICVVSRAEKELVGTDDQYRRVLYKRTNGFFKSVYPLIKNGSLIPLTE